MNVVFNQFAHGSPTYLASLELRTEILRKPLGLGWNDFPLSQEPHFLHLGAFVEGTLCGSLILQPIDTKIVKMRQVAIASALQGKGLGSGLVNFAEQMAKEKGYKTMTAHARESAIPFYLRLGYSCTGKTFTEVSLPHRTISKCL